MSILSLAVVVVAALVMTTCYSLPMNNAGATAVGGEIVNQPLHYHVQIKYWIHGHLRYCYGAALTQNYIAAPVYGCIDDFIVGDKTHIIDKVTTSRKGHGSDTTSIRKKYSKLYNEVNLARDIGIIKVKDITFLDLPTFAVINSHLSQQTPVATYGFGSLFSTGNEALQMAESFTVTRRRARFQYPLKVHDYTLGIKVSKSAANTSDIGSPIITKNGVLVGLLVYSDHDVWDLKHDTVILGQEICGATMGEILEKWTNATFCQEEE